jgi:hypothetical protein
MGATNRGQPHIWLFASIEETAAGSAATASVAAPVGSTRKLLETLGAAH